MTVSAAHERRVQLLSAMGHLAGCHGAVRLDSVLEPDVVLANARRRILLVGDAKETETAGRRETERRLRRYLRGVQVWRRDGYTVRVAVCAASCSGDWETLLRSMILAAVPPDVAGGNVLIDPSSQVAWIDLPTLAPVAPLGDC